MAIKFVKFETQIADVRVGVWNSTTKAAIENTWGIHYRIDNRVARIFAMLPFLAGACVPPVPRPAANEAACAMAPSDMGIEVQELEQAAASKWGGNPSECEGRVTYLDLNETDYATVGADLPVPWKSTCGTMGFCGKNLDRPVVMIRNQCDNNKAVVVHELAHYFLWCSTGDTDNGHTRSDVWGDKGFVWDF